jgi:ubiquinone/menaquinone biosynthesis C-methylase UbiE
MSSHNHYSALLARMYDPMIHPAVRNIRKTILKEVVNLGALSVIDMCCGTGDPLKYLQKAGIGGLTGIDISDNMLRQAHRNGLEGICRKMDASDTTFASNSFDAAIISFALHEMHHSTAGKVMEEARRITRTGGKIIITDYLLDQRTGSIGRLGATFVEWMVGGDHYRNFRFYNHTNLMNTLIRNLSLTRTYQFAWGAVAVWVLEKK